MEILKLKDGSSTAVSSVSTKQIIKIWVTKPNAEEPLGGFLNELRLIREIQKHPDKNLTLVYEPNNLSTEALQKIHDFARINQITLLSVDEIEVTLNQLGEDGQISAESLSLQQKLLACVRKEMQLPGGNLAAASDILRTLTPILTGPEGPRMYLDVDESLLVHIPDTLDLPQNVLVKNKDNNNFMLCPQPESELMKHIRSKILSHYENEAILKETLLSAGFNAIFPLRLRMGITYAQKVQLDSIHSIFEFREMVTRQINEHQTAHDAQPLDQEIKDKLTFWKNLYLFSVIDITGPAIYNPQYDSSLNNSSFKIRFISSDPLASDISWGHEPRHLEEEQRMKEAGQKINFFVQKHHVKTPQGSSDEEDRQSTPSL